MGSNALKVLAAKPGTDPYQPGVDVKYADGTSENVRVDYSIWIKENRHRIVK